VTWQIAVIGAVAVLGVLGLVWIFAGRWVSASKGGAVAKDDKQESDAVIAAKTAAEEVERATPKSARALRRWLRGE